MNKKTGTVVCRGAMILSAASALAGCVHAPQPLYGWGSYQGQVYEYLKGQGSAEAEVIALEADLEKMRAKGESPPPGFHAHLGLLYASLGKEEATVREFQTEKSLFPESGHYVDFLLSKNKK
jgi:hypothetical protein